MGWFFFQGYPTHYKTYIAKNDQIHTRESYYGRVKILGPFYNPTSSSPCIVIGDENKNDVPALEGGYDGDTKINGNFKKARGSDMSDTFLGRGDINDSVDGYVVELHKMTDDASTTNSESKRNAHSDE